jgi:hypothetical protein
MKGVSGQQHAPAALYPGKDPVPIVQEAGWAPGSVWTGAENLAPKGIRSPDRPARSQSLRNICNNCSRTCVCLCVCVKVCGVCVCVCVVCMCVCGVYVWCVCVCVVFYVCMVCVRVCVWCVYVCV